MKSAAAIGFDYVPSQLIAVATLLVLGFALSALMLSGVPAWSKAVLAIAACVYGGWSVRKFMLPPCRRLTWHEAGHWRHADVLGNEQAAQLRHAVVLGDLVALSFRLAPRASATIILLPDNSDAELRRRLRARLARTRDGENQPA
jgi:toxin CptA